MTHDDMRSSTVGAEELFLESGVSTNHIPNILPHERVFPVQLGSELFKLSGASISSDGASLTHTWHRTPGTQEPGSYRVSGLCIKALH